MTRLRSLLARLLTLVRQIDGQDIMLVAGSVLLAAGLWRLTADWALAALWLGAFALTLWAWPLVVAGRRPPGGRH